MLSFSRKGKSQPLPLPVLTCSPGGPKSKSTLEFIWWLLDDFVDLFREILFLGAFSFFFIGSPSTYYVIFIFWLIYFFKGKVFYKNNYTRIHIPQVLTIKSLFCDFAIFGERIMLIWHHDMRECWFNESMFSGCMPCVSFNILMWIAVFIFKMLTPSVYFLKKPFFLFLLLCNSYIFDFFYGFYPIYMYNEHWNSRNL